MYGVFLRSVPVARFESVTAVIVPVAVFRIVVPCSVIGFSQPVCSFQTMDVVVLQKADDRLEDCKALLSRRR
jgi:hypothetical protein